MSAKDKLQIVLITYNRSQYLKKTLEQILCDDSPIRNFDITIIDNKSTDETYSVVKSEQANHPNLKYIKNNFNVGGNANIAKALEMANNKYLWVLCDDDNYDWSGWQEVEDFIENDALLIAASNFDIPEAHRSDLAYIIGQFTFLPSIIINTSLLNDTVIRNAYDSTVFLFPHLASVITHINSGGEISIVKKSIVNPGHYGNDPSYLRGNVPAEVFLRSRTMFFIAGFANLCINLNDKKLARRCIEVRIAGDYAQRTGYFLFYINLFLHMAGPDYTIQLRDLNSLLPISKRIIINCVHLVSRTPLPRILLNSPIYTLAIKMIEARRRSVKK